MRGHGGGIDGDGGRLSRVLLSDGTAVDAERTRIEHWTNAREQTIAPTMLADHGAGGEATPYSPVPYVRSEQYGSRIQVAGRPSPHLDAVRVVHRDDATDATVAVYRDGDTLVGAPAINAPKRLLPYRRMIADRVRWEDALAAC